MVSHAILIHWKPSLPLLFINVCVCSITHKLRQNGEKNRPANYPLTKNNVQRHAHSLTYEYTKLNEQREYLSNRITEKKNQQRIKVCKNKRNSVRPDDGELLTSIYFWLIRDGSFLLYSLHNVFLGWIFMYIACFQVI